LVVRYDPVWLTVNTVDVPNRDTRQVARVENAEISATLWNLSQSSDGGVLVNLKSLDHDGATTTTQAVLPEM